MGRKKLAENVTRISTRMPTQLYQALKKQANKKKTTVSKLLRSIAEKWVKNTEDSLLSEFYESTKNS